jgi:ABC-type glutathione transport system ATPase component
VTALAILGLLPAHGCSRSGRILLVDEDLTMMSESALQRVRGNRIAMIFQEPMSSLNPVYNCGEQVAEVFRLHQKASRRQAASRALEMFERVQLSEPARVARSYPHQLSGGMRQRVMIAMALACGPQLLIADEPTTALDVTIQAQILSLLQKIQQEDGLAILLITHDLGVVGEMADRLEIVQNGVILESGATRDIFRAPQQDYTKQLLAALPSRRARRRGSLPGTVAGKNGAATALLVVRDLRTHFVDRRSLWGKVRSHVKAVDGVSFELAAGETLGVVGESGSGKSTLARSILRLVEPTAGSVTFAGQAMQPLQGEGLRRMRRRMQIVFQDPFASLNPRIRVGDAIAEVLHVHRIVPAADVRTRVASLLKQVDLDPARQDQYPHEFSGGERQRLVIARALAVEPELLLCDEPVSSLDVSVQAQILDLLGHLQDSLNLSYLFISHEIRVVRQICDRVAVMQAGTFVEVGPVNEVLGAPEHAYTRQLLASSPRDPRAPRP